MRILIVFLPIASAVWFTTTIVLAGFNHTNYRHGAQFISELGATGTANGQIVNFLGFVPSSALLTAFVFLAIFLGSRKVKEVFGLIAIGVYALTLSVAAFYPCDLGCRPDSPSTSQIIHNLSAVLGYASGIVGVFVLASVVTQKGSNSLGSIGYSLGALALLMFFLLKSESPFVGLVQRAFEASMYTWAILYAFHLQSGRATLASTEVRAR